MKGSRSHVHELALAAPASRVFEMLHTPSDIRRWWSAACAIVIPREGGVWTAAWGAEEDDPEYVGSATILAFEPPCRLKLGEFLYDVRGGAPPIDWRRLSIDFTVSDTTEGCILRIVHDGFPPPGEHDDFYKACELGWKDTLEAIERHLADEPGEG